MSGSNMRSAPVYPDTLLRLKWVKNQDVLDRKSYDWVINAMLDHQGAPTGDEIRSGEAPWFSGDFDFGEEDDEDDDSTEADD